MAILSRICGEPLRFFGGIELFIRHFWQLELLVTIDTLIKEVYIPAVPLFPYPGCILQAGSHRVSDLTSW